MRSGSGLTGRTVPVPAARGPPGPAGWRGVTGPVADVPVKRARRGDDHPDMRLSLALVLLVLALTGCGEQAVRPAAASAPAPAPGGRAVIPAAATPVATGPRERPLSLAIGYLRRDTLRKQAVERWRLAELEKAKRSRTV